MKFGIGQPVRRTEDPRLLTGRGNYADDNHAEGQLYAVFVRSPHAHAVIKEVNTDDAKEVPGVVAVYTGKDVEKDNLGRLPCGIERPREDGVEMSEIALKPLMASDKVRHAGDTIAMIVAETVEAGKDATELVDADYDMLDPVANIQDSLAVKGDPIWDEAPDNKAFFFELGDKKETEEAFDKAAHVCRLEIINNRVVPNAMEPRACLATYDKEKDHLTLVTSSQGAHFIRKRIVDNTLKVSEDQITVLSGDVGGGFGAKIYHFAEDALCLWAAKKLNKPIKWTAERSETFNTDVQGRGQESWIEAAINEDHEIMAVRAHTYADMGAYLSQFGGLIPSTNTGMAIPCVYRFPYIYFVSEGVFTNTPPMDAYRGAGRPEAVYLMERFMDEAARQLGISPDEFRRKNFIRPDEMPFTTATGREYDVGEFETVMELAKKDADWPGFEERRKESEKRGRLRGIGMSTYLETCGKVGAENARVSVTPEGKIEVDVGTQDNGQGHRTAYAQIAAERLGVELDDITVIQGNSDRLPMGGGTMGSRSMVLGGNATDLAAVNMIRKGTGIAAQLLQTEPDAVEYEAGTFRTKDGKQTVSLKDVARLASDKSNLPEDMEPGLSGYTEYEIDNATYPNGCHICELEVDPETGKIHLLRYVVKDDFGNTINPLLLEGQVHGGIAQGIGQAFIERTVHDPETAQIITGSFMDYAIPHANDLCNFEFSMHNVPATTNPFGIKGAGEAGTIGACPAAMNALMNALSYAGVEKIDMPATPLAVWEALQQAKAA